MRPQDSKSFIAGLLVATLLACSYVPTTQAFVVVQIRDGKFVSVIQGNDTGPFQHWDLSKFPNKKIPYKINDRGSDDLTLDETKAGVDAAFNLWRGAGGTPIDFENAGYTQIAKEANDGENVVFWDETGEFFSTSGFKDKVKFAVTPILINHVNQTTAEILDADVIFNGTNVGRLHCGNGVGRSVRIKWSLTQNGCGGKGFRSLKNPVYYASLPLIGGHEVGHFIGLDHSNVTGSIMVDGNTSVGSLSADDIAGVKFLYASAPVSPCAVSEIFGNPPAQGVPTYTYGSDDLVQFHFRYKTTDTTIDYFSGTQYDQNCNKIFDNYPNVSTTPPGWLLKERNLLVKVIQLGPNEYKFRAFNEDTGEPSSVDFVFENFLSSFQGPVVRLLVRSCLFTPTDQCTSGSMATPAVPIKKPT